MPYRIEKKIDHTNTHTHTHDNIQAKRQRTSYYTKRKTPSYFVWENKQIKENIYLYDTEHCLSNIEDNYGKKEQNKIRKINSCPLLIN